MTMVIRLIIGVLNRSSKVADPDSSAPLFSFLSFLADSFKKTKTTKIKPIIGCLLDCLYKVLVYKLSTIDFNTLLKKILYFK